MRKLISLLKQRRNKNKQESGQGIIEYVLILAFVALAVVLVVQVLEPSIADTFSRLVRRAPVAPPSLVNYTPPPPTNTATSTATVDPSLPTATATHTPSPVPTDTPTPTSTPTPIATPTSTGTPAPCLYGPYTVPGRVQAEDFTCGGPGTAFNENGVDGGPGSSSYRADVADDGPDLETTSDTGGGYNVGWTRDDEWLRYEIESSEVMAAKILLRYAAPGDGARVQFRVTQNNLSDQSGIVTLPETGGWQNWQNYEISPIAIYSGTNTIELFIDNEGANFNYFEVDYFVPCTLPNPWQSLDVGTVSALGSGCEDQGTFTVEGSGDDIWDKNDEFQYVYRALNGDGTITARITGQTDTDGWAKAGVMIRETLADDSPFAFTAVSPDNDVNFFYRKNQNNNAKRGNGTGDNIPIWVRLERSGNTLTSYRSANGTNWTQIDSETINMNENVYVGLAVTSHDDGTLSTVTFTDVELTTGGTNPPIDFNDYTIESYGGGQDENPTVSIEDGGTTLRIVGNGWKKIAFPYDITADTVLEFDFESSVEGEIHGIGFDNDDNLSGNRIFRLYGTQNWGRNEFDNYAGETPKHYVIPVGQYYTGSFAYLVFANDDDANAAAESIFSNIRVYEAP